MTEKQLKDIKDKAIAVLEVHDNEENGWLEQTDDTDLGDAIDELR